MLKSPRNNAQWRNEGEQGRRPPPGADEKGAQNELTGIYFDIF